MPSRSQAVQIRVFCALRRGCRKATATASRAGLVKGRNPVAGRREQRFAGGPFFPGDLSLRLPGILIVTIGVPVAAAAAARLALRRVHISRSGSPAG